MSGELSYIVRKKLMLQEAYKLSEKILKQCTKGTVKPEIGFKIIDPKIFEKLEKHIKTDKLTLEIITTNIDKVFELVNEIRGSRPL